jgi:putative oxidoreductase
MEYLFLLGRILYGGVLIFMGLNHFMNLQQMTGYAESKGVPSAQIAVIGSAILLIVGAISIITGYQTTIGVGLLAVFFIPVTLMMHPFWKDEDPAEKMGNMTNFMKNIVILGGALMFLQIEAWPLSLAIGG